MSYTPKLVVIKGIESCDVNKLERFIEGMSKREKIKKYLFDKDKVSAIISEMIVRIMYCEERKKKNSKIIFDKNKFGKPFIKDDKEYYFNISHSNDMVVGIFDNEEVGIDIEFSENLNLEIAKIFCTESEYSRILEKKEEDRIKEISFLWSLKESYLKWKGTGISEELNKLEIKNKKSVEFYCKEYSDYSLCICSRKKMEISDILEEMSVDEILMRYELIA